MRSNYLKSKVNGVTLLSLRPRLRTPPSLISMITANPLHLTWWFDNSLENVSQSSVKNGKIGNYLLVKIQITVHI